MPFDGVTKTHKPTLAQQLVAARIQYARNQIAKGNWCQNQIIDSHGNRCLVGWLEFNPNCQIGHAAISWVWASLPKTAQSPRTHNGVTDLANYNDTHKRNTIVQLLNRAIVAMETMDHA